MRLGAWVAVALISTLLTTPVAAQTTTEDGIRATLRGDYKAAARILRPLADDTTQPDPVAQFFLGILYQTGQGVTADLGRACGLFLRSSSRAHPFAEQSAAFATHLIQNELGDGARILCVADEHWQGGPPQSFVLGPDHRIVFADTSVTVTDGDKETRAILIPQDATWIRVRYTPLDVKLPVAGRRHFIQWSQWTADSTTNPSSWTLAWALSEVVGDQWNTIIWESDLSVVNSRTRPALSDMSSLVGLRTNARGEAEFAVLAGHTPRTEVIPWQGKQ